MAVHADADRRGAPAQLDEHALLPDAGVVTIEPLDDGDAFAARVAESAQLAETDVVWLSCKAPPPELDVPVQVLPLEIGPRRTDGWVDLARALVAHLT